MSSVLVEYPEGLPAPMTGNVSMTERRKASSIGGRQNFRTFQRDRHGTRSVAFVFTPMQSAIFREWWREWLQRGGGWFAANWPLPWTREASVFRFQEPPQWTLIGGGLDGQGFWRVSGIVEIRGRGMLPTMEVLYLTSTPYPLYSADAFTTVAINVKQPPEIYPSDNMQLDAAVVGIYARDIYNVYDIGYEKLEVSARLVSAAAQGTIYSTMHIPLDSLGMKSTIVSIESRVALITYQNYTAEKLNLTATLISITSTGT